MNWYKVSEEYEALMLKVEEYAKDHGGEIEDHILDELTNADANMAEAQEWALLRAKQEQLFAQSCKEEIARLKAKMDHANVSHEKFISIAVKLGAVPCKTAQYELKLSKSEAVVIDDESKLSVLLITEKKTTAPNKTAIKKAIKAGETVEGAHIEKRETFKMPELKKVTL